MTDEVRLAPSDLELERAERYADGTGKVPVVFARERGDGRPVAILRLEDFLEMILEARQ
jgi:hypothetical protein